MSWELKKLNEIVVVKSGKRLPKGHSFITDSNNHPYIRARDIKNGKIKVESPVYITDDTFNIISRYIVSENDVVITIVGANVGDIAIIDSEYNGANLTENAAKLIPKDNNILSPQFLKYSLFGDVQKSKFQQIAMAAAQPKLGFYKIKDFEINVPNIQTQKRIADILSTYDDLIENNLKRIKLLEQATQNIYKEWFVNLRFPRHENTPIDKETGLPKGWEVCTINDVCEKVASGGTPSRRNNSYWDNSDYLWVTTKELRDGFILDIKESISKEGLKNSSAKLFPEGTVLMAIYASPTLGRLGILSKEACFNQAAVGFICDNNKITNQFLYYLLYAERANLNAIAIGAAQQNINVSKVKAHEIILPPFQLVESYTRIILSNYEMRLNLATQNQKLKVARDILLPRLMNRTIEVSWSL